MSEEQEKEQLKFWQKSWFMWVCLILIAPVGIFLCYINRERHPKWKIICGVFLVLFVIGLAAPGSKDKTPATSNTTQSQEVKKVETAKKEEPKKEEVKKEEPKKEEPKPVAKKKEPNWNKSEIDATKNGNMAIAAEIVRTEKDSIKQNAETVNAADVIKRPWDYYGKVYKFQGESAVLQDYPPTSDIGKALGGDACEIVMTCGAQETIVDGMLAGNTKGLQEGSTVEIYGYVVGTMEVDNKIGGKFTHLIVVGVR